MSKFQKKGKAEMPELNTSSLPDLIFSILFFFMMVTSMREVELKDEANIVQRIIETLPEQQRQIVKMHDVDDFSYEEIEQATGLTTVNIRVLLSRARKKIREQFNAINSYEYGKNQ